MEKNIKKATPPKAQELNEANLEEVSGGGASSVLLWSTCASKLLNTSNKCSNCQKKGGGHTPTCIYHPDNARFSYLAPPKSQK